mgnify:FL=1
MFLSIQLSYVLHSPLFVFVCLVQYKMLTAHRFAEPTARLLLLLHLKHKKHFAKCWSTCYCIR